MKDLQQTIAATASFLRLLEEAEKCRQLHLLAKMPLPPPLLAMLEGESPKPVQLTLGMSSPELDLSREGTRPTEATEDWISLRAEDVAATTITLAVLRGQDGKSLRAKEVSDLIAKIRPDIASGSIYNLLNRLRDEGLVHQDDLGWKLLDPTKAGVLVDKYLWAPPTILSKTDLAAQRREAIVYLLQQNRHLQVMQIVTKLREWEWIKAPINKDLLKADMQVLEEKGAVRRIGNSRNWEVAR